jgi:acyl dehydratase
MSESIAMNIPDTPPPYFFEDLHVGQVLVSPARTITETDVVNFAGISGDFNPIHTDVEFARSSVYGQRVVYGLLGLAVLTGLTDRARFFSGSAIALLGIDDWRFVAPIFIGDTVHYRMEVTALKPSKKPDRGVVERHFQLINQRGEVVQEGELPMMVRTRAWARGEA